MTLEQDAGVPPGWVGGFAESNPAFAYPDPDLNSLDMLDNMDNIDLLTRQQAVLWPEFSWLTVPGDAASRCFQMFAPDISRIGYTDTGRVYSIICPQQGVCSRTLGCLNIEVTVTGQRGWVVESARKEARTLAADMTVEGKIWFSPSAKQEPMVRFLWSLFDGAGLPFPTDKAHAIIVTTYKDKTPTQPIFPVRTGQSSLFQSPDFALHPEAWTVGHLGVEIGPIKATGDEVVDAFNQMVMNIFNTVSGNLLLAGNLLTWNVWFTKPALVDTQEWRDHAEKWRKSINADHGSPDGPGTTARYFDGSPFIPGGIRAQQETGDVGAQSVQAQQETDMITDYLKTYLPQL